MANYFKGFALVSVVLLLGAGCNQKTQPIVQTPLENTPAIVTPTSEVKPDFQTPEAREKQTIDLKVK